MVPCSETIPSQKWYMNMALILSGYDDTDVWNVAWLGSYLCTGKNTVQFSLVKCSEWLLSPWMHNQTHLTIETVTLQRTTASLMCLAALKIYWPLCFHIPCFSCSPTHGNLVERPVDHHGQFIGQGRYCVAFLVTWGCSIMLVLHL
jgi:hypothetical protein